jgi:putative oxidoreductase
VRGPIPPAWAPYVQGLLRIVCAFLFVAHGTQKLFGYPPAEGMPPLLSLIGVAGVLELVGGLLLLVGLWTRPVAFVLSGQMAVAYFTAHAPNGFWPMLNGGELAVLYWFVWLFFAAAGPGALSVDGRRSP